MITTLILYVCSISFISDPLVRSLELRYTPSASIEGDVIVVLMGGSTVDTPGIGGPGHPSGETAGRLITAASLYFKLGVPIIVSGGQVYAESGYEGEIGKRTLVAMGVPEKLVFVENSSRSTTENVYNIKPILDKSGYLNPILITSALHMTRSVRNFDKIGVEIEPYPTAYMVSKKFKLNISHFYPSYEAVNKTGHALKEYLGLILLEFQR
ncbi:MAG TPA: YdcF family protein [Bacilli bacterium]